MSQPRKRSKIAGSTLNLYFTGLCAFVPNTAYNRARVLLVDASKPHGGHDKPHVAVLVFRSESLLDPDGKPPDPEKFRSYDSIFPDGNNAKMGLCNLQDQDLWIDKAPDKSLTFDKADLKDCPDLKGTQDDYFGWVAPMKLINAGDGDVPDECFADKNVPYNLAARIGLTAGSLGTNAFVRDGSAVIRWEFKPVDGTPGNPAGQRQALAEEVVLKYQFDGNYVDLASASGIHGGAPIKNKPLRLYTQGDTVSAWVANMPLDEITSRYYGGASGKSASPGPNYHFIHYYYLLKGGTSLRVPHPFTTCPLGTGGPTVDSPRCPPVRMAANQYA